MTRQPTFLRMTVFATNPPHTNTYRLSICDDRLSCRDRRALFLFSHQPLIIKLTIKLTSPLTSKHGQRHHGNPRNPNQELQHPANQQLVIGHVWWYTHWHCEKARQSPCKHISALSKTYLERGRQLCQNWRFIEVLETSSHEPMLQHNLQSSCVRVFLAVFPVFSPVWMRILLFLVIKQRHDKHSRPLQVDSMSLQGSIYLYIQEALDNAPPSPLVLFLSERERRVLMTSEGDPNKQQTKLKIDNELQSPLAAR